jgi:hypothetical protein
MTGTHRVRRCVFFVPNKKGDKVPGDDGRTNWSIGIKSAVQFRGLICYFFFVFRRWECKARCPPPPLRWTSWASPLTVLRSRQRQGTVELVWDGWIMDKGLLHELEDGFRQWNLRGGARMKRERRRERARARARSRERAREEVWGFAEMRSPPCCGLSICSWMPLYFLFFCGCRRHI